MGGAPVAPEEDEIDMHHRHQKKVVTQHTVTLNAEDIRRALYEYAHKMTGITGDVCHAEPPYWQARGENPEDGLVRICSHMSACSAVQLIFATETLERACNEGAL